MKVAVIGGGSTYTPELVNGFLARMAQLPVSELWLMDIVFMAVIVGFFAVTVGLVRFCAALMGKGGRQ